MCPRPNPPYWRANGSQSDSGFSLLELLVVLAIMSVMLSLAGATMIKNIESTRFARTADAVMAEVLTIRADAVLTGAPRVIVSQNRGTPQNTDINPAHIRRLSLPNGWQILGDPVQISERGICGGGRLRVIAPSGRRAEYALSAPKCAATRIPLNTG